ncbi:MAG: response regulator transcription factor [Lachnospiraceae bacterium]
MEFISTMIVEDEKIILEDIKTIIDWRQHGFDIVATAVNGKQGLSKYEQFRPALIISDIKMPVMDGISMLKSIKRQNPSVQFLVLSAYSDFQYAKEAIRLGAQDYILKTELSAGYMLEKLNVINNLINREQNSAFRSIITHFSEAITSTPAILTNSNFAAQLLAAESLPPTIYQRIIDETQALLLKRYHDIGLKEPTTKLQQPQSLTDLNKQVQTVLSEIESLYEMIYVRQFSPIIINAIDYILLHYSNPNIKISDIGAYVGLSSGRLSVLFKEALGQTINEYITERRIEEAKKLLLSGKYKVYEISELVGYKTSQYFSQVFTQATGQNPNNYRKGID